MKIATWNVNSVKARLPNVVKWLRTAKPDVVLLQEIKCQSADFPETEIGDLGYNIAVHGQKSYNGVAILSKLPIEDVVRGLPTIEDEQSRYIEATVNGLRVASIYLPNGNPVDTEKFTYKLRWMEALRAHAKELLTEWDVLALGGDYNVCPADADVYDPEAFANDALCRPESRNRFRALLHLGLIDAYRAKHPAEANQYSYWDYQQRAWPQNHGLRIDHLLLNGPAWDRMAACDIDRSPRGADKASDHTPVWCEIGT
ncbi:MAG TPA: exodeoxyribonuclease III [Candidatus Cybelea sp.]|nr:exodeoxyribonuclease III [Candidatus Cybelea sp.]